MDYTVIGDGVNVSSRIEGLNKQYGTDLLISATTHAQLSGGFITRTVDNVIMKGKTLPIRLYEVLGERGFRMTEEQKFFVEGLQVYEARNFQDALTWFERGTAEDNLCRVFEKRCQQFLQTPPPDNWDGVWRALSK